MLPAFEKSRLCIALISSLLAVASFPATADDLFQEQAKLINAPKSVGVLGADLFGDQVNFYSGSLTFTQTDISIKGNNALPVSIGRRLEAGSWGIGNRQFGRWELDIPHLHGMFSEQRGWTVPDGTGGTGARCSRFGKPQGVTSSYGGIGLWNATEYWHGSFLYIPGSGDQEMLRRNLNPHIPSDGALYPVVTRDLWAISCLPSLKNDTTPAKTGGEGFLAVSPDGTRYQFDWKVSRAADPIEKGTTAPQLAASPSDSEAKDGTSKDATKEAKSKGRSPNDPAPMIAGDGEMLARQEVWILPTLVTDKFGNTVTYTYDTTRPWQLKSITASDGRSISLTYVPNTDVIATATAMPNTTVARTWTYAYNIGQMAELTSVTLPNGSSWKLQGVEPLLRDINYLGSPRCENPGVIDDQPLVGSMTHPSGAVGTFTLTPTIHGRAGVLRVCKNAGTIGEYSHYPNYFANHALTKKVLSGPGIGTLQWSTVYPAAVSSWDPCNGCIASKKVAVTDPSGNVTQYTFGTLNRKTEGQLQQTDIFDSNANLLRSTRVLYRDPAVGPFPNPMGTSDQARGDGEFASRMHVEEQRITTQQGVDFTWQVNGIPGIDAKGRAVDVTRSSTLGYSKRELTSFDDITNKWVLGLLTKVTDGETGAVPVANEYDQTFGTLLKTKRFGFVDRTITYRADGTVSSQRDGKDQTTSYSNFKRGVAQSISYQNAATEGYLVNEFGEVTSHTDQNGYTTSFLRDTLGRVTEITPPAGGNVAWNKTTVAYEWVPTAEFNVGAGHWRQTVSTGAAAEVNIFDAFWRVVYSTQYDRNNPAATSKFSYRSYDFKGNTLHTSFPKRSFAEMNGGVTNAYDALNRPTLVRTDSELGAVNATFTYGANFSTTGYDGRGNATTKTFQAFDQPSEGAVVNITAPEGVSVVIDRDDFGKAKSITRSGGGKSATRSYVYDAMHRLCKTIEPETGATIQDYDLANNVTWRATGLALPSASCDTLSVPAGKKISFGYDVLNRLETTTYGDLSPGITRSYWPDGLPKTVNSNGVNWTYTYNARRLIETETLGYGGVNYALTHGYDANGSKASLTYPDNTSVAYAPNALGEASQVGTFATGILYHPNGAIKNFVYGNGIFHSMAQNARGLPENSGNTGILNDTYGYDANANVRFINDNYELATHRIMEYDGLDRLKRVSAPAVWGDAFYTYDALDNLTGSTFTGGTGIARTMVHNYPDGTNRLMSVTGTAGFAVDYAYDTQGNITQRGAQSYVFDQGNRITAATGKATYVYDGLGRRSSTVTPDGVNRLQLYSQDGRLMFAGPTNLTKTKYIYINNHVLAEVNGASIEYIHTDGLGSPIARSNTGGGLISRTRYEPYGRTAAGATPTIGFTGHVNDVDTGLTYMQQRYYDPVAGRFLSIDPVVTDANTGDSFNRYAYGNNSPYKYIDPDGRGNLLVTVGGSAVFGAGIEGSGGIYLNMYPEPDIGIVLSGGVALGANVGLGVAVASIPGPVSNISGPTTNVNVSTPLVSGTIMRNPETGKITGKQLALGAKLGVSVAQTNTGTWGLRGLVQNIMAKISPSPTTAPAQTPTSAPAPAPVAKRPEPEPATPAEPIRF